MRGRTWIDGIRQDFIFGWRGLRRAPALLGVALLSLGLGVGVNLAIFSLLDAVLLRDVTAVRPDRLVRLRVGPANQVSHPNYRDLRAAARADEGPLADLAGVARTPVQWQRGDRVERLLAQVATANFFDLLGARARVGRLFSEVDAGRSGAGAPATGTGGSVAAGTATGGPATAGTAARPAIADTAVPGAARGASIAGGALADTHVVVLSHGFWQARFEGDPGILGRVLTLNGQPMTVIGVLPRSYVPVGEPGATPQIYLPASDAFGPPLDARDQLAIELVGRLRDGVSRTRAQAMLQPATDALERAHPIVNKGLGATPPPPRASDAASPESGAPAAPHAGADARVRTTMRVQPLSGVARLTQAGAESGLLATIMLGAVISLVFLVACANVAGLLLARGLGRRREIAIRLALGASRARVVRQLLIEALTLAALCTLAGLGCSIVATRLVSRIPLPTPMPFELAIAVDARLLLYACALAAAATLLCGLAPAWRAARGSLTGVMQQGAAATTRASRLRWLAPRHLLVIAQIAGSIVLLVTALLFVRSLSIAARVDPGFDTTHTLSASLQLPPARRDEATLRVIEAEAIASLRSMPGVQAASCAAFTPVSFSGAGAEVRGEQDDVTPRGVDTNAVCADYFRTMGIPLRRGREFTDADRGGAPAVAIVNETLARQAFGDADPIGRRLVQVMQIGGETIRQPIAVVGVARDSIYGTLGEAPRPMLYRPFAQPPAIRRQAVLIVRAAAAPEAVRWDVERTLARVDPSLLATVVPLRDTVEASMTPGRIASALLGTVGALGLLLASVGLYGAIAFAVTQRTREFGIRLALGATRGAILRLVLTDSARLVAIGALLGASLAWLLVTPLRAFLAAGLSPTDPRTFALVLALLATVGLVAGLPPARRAARTDPQRTLRTE